MTDPNLVQLGIVPETGAHTEEPANGSTSKGITEGVGATSPLLDDARPDNFISHNGHVYAGHHLIIEVVDGRGLDDEDRIQQAFRDCVDTCGATLLHIHTHKFSPQGVSGVAVLAESHISVHTWPEIGYGAFDIFMCGDAQPWKSVDVLKAAFETADVRVRELRRGEGVIPKPEATA